MKVTLITATYNSEKNIKDCLQSVAGQDYPHIEHLVVDGGSSDGTMEIVKSFPSVSGYVSEPDHGIYDALNKGIKMATGDLIGFVHSDDMLASNDIISRIANSFSTSNSKDKIDGVYGDLFFVDPEDTGKVVRAWFSKPYNPKGVNFGWAPAHPTLFLRKEVYERHGLFDTSFNIAGDYDFMVRIMKDPAIRLYHLPKILVKMRKGGASTGDIKSLLDKKQEDIRVLKKHGFCYPFLVLLLKNLRKIPQLFHSINLI